MKPENYKLALRRARKAAKKILEENDNVVFEAINRKRHPVLVSIGRCSGLVRIIYICLEGEKYQDCFDSSLPHCILQQAWIKQQSKNYFRPVSLPEGVFYRQTS